MPSEPAATTLGAWLLHVMRRAESALSLEEALHLILDSMKVYFPCQSVAVMLIDDQTKELQIKISRQISYSFIKQFRRGGPSELAERIVLEQRPILLNNADPSSDVYRSLKLEHEFTSAVVAPIIRHQRGVGYVFADRQEGSPFTESDLLHMQVIGLLIGSMMEKFDLIRTARSLSQFDDASHALNYKAFVAQMGTELQRARTHRYPLGLALIAAEDFRRYVEVYGVGAAHALLAEMVTLIREQIRDMDLLGRFGADELILCLSGFTRIETEAKLTDLVRMLRERSVGKGEGTVRVTIGGVALERPECMSRPLQDIFAALGRQLVEARSAGGGKPVIATME